MPFSAWLERIHEPRSPLAEFTFPGYVTLNGGGYLYEPLWERCDALLRYEELAEELRLLLDQPSISLPRYNTTPHKRDYRCYYDGPLRREIEGRYHDELQELGYSFDNGRPWETRDDCKPLTGGGLFDASNQRRRGLREYHNWPNRHNNPA